jgi:hypothetical protein
MAADLGRAIGLFGVLVAIFVATPMDATVTVVDVESFSSYLAIVLLPSSSLAAAVGHRVLNDAGRWFPEMAGADLQIRINPGRVRPRCYIYRIDLDDGRLRRAVLLKVRHSVAAHRRLDRYAGERPVLSPEHTIPDEAAAVLEFGGLEQISLFARSDERFEVVRGLGCLPEHAAIVMDLVDQPTLLMRVLATSRTRHPRHTPGPEVPLQVWTNAGAWLRTYHDRLDVPALPVHLGSSDEVGALYAGYAEFLGRHLHGSTFPRRLERTTRRCTASWLDDPLPLAVGHGDFVANNVFVSERGGVAGFDPLPCWRVARYKDLATLVVGMRIHPVQAMSQGWALDRSRLAVYENAFHRGYFGDGEVPTTALQAFQLLALLDRWADLLSKTVSGGVKSRLRATRVRLASHYYQAETRHMLQALQGAQALT